jgi:hypothetical protein
MIAGDLAEPHFAAGVRETLYERALPRATQRLQIEISPPSDGVAIAGACAMVVEAVFAPAEVDRRLAGLSSVTTSR